ncbi:MAG TPA: hypothetical protein VID77_03135 [Stellaceae bacterium]|jgi:hypothetical protein
MVFELDIWQAANDLVSRYQHRAVVQAARRIDECRRSGDWRSQEAWETILKAVDAIQARKPPVTRATRLTLPAELRIIRAK